MRSRYVDLLRAAAIARVMLYHTFGRAWLTILFPSMGVMFALAGSLMASSMETRGPRSAVTSRVRRLLPPLWAYGLIAVSVMLWAGWSEKDPHHPLSWSSIAMWIVPVNDPKGSSWGEPLWDVLWYLRAYLWFVLLTPLIYLVYRWRWWVALAAPLAGLGLLTISGAPVPGTVHSNLWDLAIYGPCWIIGFAHQDGRLARLRLPVLFTVAGISAAGGIAWLMTHHVAHDGDLNDIPVAQALWSFAFVLLLLRWRPRLDWLDRIKPLASAVRFVNSRAVTIYLWHNPLITVAGAIVSLVIVHHAGEWPEVVVFGVAVLLTGVATLAFGWVEDLAARRRPALLPVPGKKAMAETV